MSDGSYIPDLYEARIIVLIESTEEGAFQQVLLSQEQYDKLLTIVFNGENEVATIDVGEVKFDADLFLGCGSVEL